jgi:hypothetical protein
MNISARNGFFKALIHELLILSVFVGLVYGFVIYQEILQHEEDVLVQSGIERPCFRGDLTVVCFGQTPDKYILRQYVFTPTNFKAATVTLAQEPIYFFWASAFYLQRFPEAVLFGYVLVFGSLSYYFWRWWRFTKIWLFSSKKE